MSEYFVVDKSRSKRQVDRLLDSKSGNFEVFLFTFTNLNTYTTNFAYDTLHASLFLPSAVSKMCWHSMRWFLQWPFDNCTRGSHIPVCIPCLLFAFLWQAKDIIAMSSTLERRPPNTQWSAPGTRCSLARIIGEKLAEASLVTSPNSSLHSWRQLMPFWECVRVTLTLLTIGWRRGEMSSGCTERRERPK